MCSRYENERSAADIAERLDGLVDILDEARHWTPREDHRPSHDVLTVYERDGRQVLGTSLWGFKKPATMGKGVVINARIESLPTSPFWRGVRRCLLPATAWIEWIEEGGKNIPHRLSLPDGEPFLVAGVCAMKEGALRMAMMMQPAPQHLAFIHHRAPLVYGMDAVGVKEPAQIIDRITVARI
jgi:putative SOS response-associated peptidase YedK